MICSNSIHYAVLSVWNTFPCKARSSETLSPAKSYLKTHLSLAILKVCVCVQEHGACVCVPSWVYRWPKAAFYRMACQFHCWTFLGEQVSLTMFWFLVLCFVMGLPPCALVWRNSTYNVCAVLPPNQICLKFPDLNITLQQLIIWLFFLTLQQKTFIKLLLLVLHTHLGWSESASAVASSSS